MTPTLVLRLEHRIPHLPWHSFSLFFAKTDVDPSSLVFHGVHAVSLHDITQISTWTGKEEDEHYRENILRTFISYTLSFRERREASERNLQSRRKIDSMNEKRETLQKMDRLNFLLHSRRLSWCLFDLFHQTLWRENLSRWFRIEIRGGEYNYKLNFIVNLRLSAFE
jgi:hypothetical protein